MPVCMPQADALLEEALFGLVTGCVEPAPVFILGSPRTGSTLLYQLVVHQLGLPFISNITNELLWSTPIVGLALQGRIRPEPSLRSRYGKTGGPFSPSEASAVMGAWCGGGHPSQTMSPRVLEDRVDHMRRTLACVESLYGGRSLVIKNAWNCFRVRSLAQTFPAARFIWIRRDACHAAASDLAARRETKGRETDWNSATPANVDMLMRLAPEAQVLENQYEFNKAIADGLEVLLPSRWTQVWYEDLVRGPWEWLGRIAVFLSMHAPRSPGTGQALDIGTASPRKDDLERVELHLRQHRDRMASFLRPDAGRSPCGD